MRDDPQGRVGFSRGRCGASKSAIPPAGPLRRLAVAAALLALMLLVTGGCGVLDQDASGGPTASPQQELSVDDARSMGLTRTDAVSVVGPTLVHTGGGSVPFHVQVVVPPAQGTSRPAASTTAGPVAVDLDFSGSCLLAGRLHPRGLVSASAGGPSSGPTAHTSSTVTRPAGATSVRATVTVAVPAGAESCHVVVDAWVAGRVYTGDDLTAIVRR
jgi:hypothetical protein